MTEPPSVPGSILDADATANPALLSAFCFRVLLKVPEMLNIPIFALAVEKGREAIEEAFLTRAAASNQVVNGNVARQLQSGRYGANRMILSRRRHERRTAIYSTWCAFAQAEHAEEFVRDHPRLGLDAIEAQNEAALRDSMAHLREGLSSGRFDLGRAPENSRLKRACEYVTASKTISSLRGNRQAIMLLRQGLALNPGVSAKPAPS